MRARRPPGHRSPATAAAAEVGPDGVLVVDSQFAPLTEKIVAAIRQVTDGRPRFLINTQTSDPSTTPITVVLNWTVGLKKGAAAQ